MPRIDLRDDIRKPISSLISFERLNLWPDLHGIARDLLRADYKDSEGAPRCLHDVAVEYFTTVLFVAAKEDSSIIDVFEDIEALATSGFGRLYALPSDDGSTRFFKALGRAVEFHPHLAEVRFRAWRAFALFMQNCIALGKY